MRSTQSLTARLTMLFALSSLAIMAGVGWMVYDVLRGELVNRHYEELSRQVERVRDLLADLNSVDQVASSGPVWRNVVVNQRGVHLSLLDEQGRLLAATSSLRYSPGTLAGARPEDDEVTRAADDWRDSGGRPYVLASAWGRVGGAGRVLIVLARERSELDSILSEHGYHVLLTVLLGSLVAAMASFLVTRYALRSIRRMADAAATIGVSNLDTRLDVERSPEELKRLAAAFNGMLEQLQDSFQRLSNYSTDIAHELRTPINNMLGQSQVALRRERRAEELRAVLESNIEECERLSRMIDNMLFLARAENAQTEILREPVDLAEEAERATEFFEALAEEAGVRLAWQGEGRIQADRSLVQRAVANLVSNAIAHTPRGGEVRIEVGTRDGRLVVSVANEGPGIPVEHVGRIFDRFYRVPAAPGRPRNGGTGLGLALVKSIMRLHGGSVSVNSSPAGPTVFTLSFPASPAQPEGAQSARSIGISVPT